MKTIGLQVKKATKTRVQPKAEEVSKGDAQTEEAPVRKKGAKITEQPKAEEVA